MKRTVTKPKQPVSGRTKLSEIIGPTGKDNAFARTLSAIRAAGTPVASSARRRKPKAPRVDPRVAEYAQVLAHAVDIFGSRIRATAWLNRPNRIFNNQSPIQVLTQDPEAVEEELVRIDEGIFF